MEKQVKGAILKTLKEVRDISVEYLRILLIYKGFYIADSQALLKILQELEAKGYIRFEESFVPTHLVGSKRVEITTKGLALVDGKKIDSDIDFEGV